MLEKIGRRVDKQMEFFAANASTNVQEKSPGQSRDATPTKKFFCDFLEHILSFLQFSLLTHMKK